MQVTRYLGWGIFSPYFLPGPIYPILSHAKPLVASQKLSMQKVPRGGVGHGAGNAAPEPTSSSVLHLVLHQQKPTAPTPLEGFCLATFPLKRNCSLRKVPWSGNKRLQNS